MSGRQVFEETIVGYAQHPQRRFVEIATVIGTNRQKLDEIFHRVPKYVAPHRKSVQERIDYAYDQRAVKFFMSRPKQIVQHDKSLVVDAVWNPLVGTKESWVSISFSSSLPSRQCPLFLFDNFQQQKE